MAKKQTTKICRETADAQLQQFKDRWGFEDPREIATGGEETSLPTEVTDRLIASIMVGRTEYNATAGKFVHTLKEPVGDRKTVDVTPTRIKQHERRVIADGTVDEAEIGIRILQLITDLSDYEISELVGSDMDTLSAIAGLITFI